MIKLIGGIIFIFLGLGFLGYFIESSYQLWYKLPMCGAAIMQIICGIILFVLSIKIKH